jgi:peptide/nickel transport system permease protein
MKRNKTLTTGLLIVASLTLIALCAPLLAPYAPDPVDADALLEPPSFRHLLGTDQLGRDTLSRLIYGARVSLGVGTLVVIIATGIGIVFGAVSGYYGGSLDYVFMRFIDVMLCFPVFFLILSIIAFLDPSLVNLVLVLGLTSWMGQARLMRAETLSLKTREYILAAKAYGASDLRIIFRHILPNGLAPVLVAAVFGVGGAILAESALSFLGLGVQPPTPSWGNMLADAKSTLGVAWWMSLSPGLAILITIAGYNLIAEGLRKNG